MPERVRQGADRPTTRWLAVAMLLGTLGVGSDARAQSGNVLTITTPPHLTLSNIQPRYYIFTRRDGRMIAQFDLEKGAVEFGPGLSAEEGARETWRLLAAQAPEFQKAVQEAKDDACWRRLLSEP